MMEKRTIVNLQLLRSQTQKKRNHTLKQPTNEILKWNGYNWYSKYSGYDEYNSQAVRYGDQVRWNEGERVNNNAKRNVGNDQGGVVMCS